MTDSDIEKEIQAKGLTAPRVTPQRLEDVIASEQFYVFPNTTFTACLLTLKNGYTVLGESACASPENFNAELGRKIARDNAKNKIWALEGYLLRQILSDDKILELSELVLKIENHYSFPCDIEWAFADDKFYILQKECI